MPIATIEGWTGIFTVAGRNSRSAATKLAGGAAFMVGEREQRRVETTQSLCRKSIPDTNVAIQPGVSTLRRCPTHHVNRAASRPRSSEEQYSMTLEEQLEMKERVAVDASAARHSHAATASHHDKAFEEDSRGRPWTERVVGPAIRNGSFRQGRGDSGGVVPHEQSASGCTCGRHRRRGGADWLRCRYSSQRLACRWSSKEDKGRRHFRPAWVWID